MYVFVAGRGNGRRKLTGQDPWAFMNPSDKESFQLNIKHTQDNLIHNGVKVYTLLTAISLLV